MPRGEIGGSTFALNGEHSVHVAEPFTAEPIDAGARFRDGYFTSARGGHIAGQCPDACRQLLPDNVDRECEPICFVGAGFMLPTELFTIRRIAGATRHSCDFAGPAHPSEGHPLLC